MNQNKIRWAIYRILKKRQALTAKRGGYSIAKLYEIIDVLYGLEMEIFGNPVAALKELTN